MLFHMFSLSFSFVGKREVHQFLAAYPDFKIRNFKVIRSKVMNEKSKRDRLVKKMESNQ